VLKVPNGTRGKLKLYLKAANTSSSQRNDDATAAIDRPAAARRQMSANSGHYDGWRDRPAVLA
jgi:hypothetical protein